MLPDHWCCEIPDPPVIQDLGGPCCSTHFRCQQGQTFVGHSLIQGGPVQECCPIRDADNCAGTFRDLGKSIFDYDCNILISGFGENGACIDAAGVCI